MDNIHLETDIAFLLMKIENEVGEPEELYREIQEKFRQMRAYGCDISFEFTELEKEISMKIAA